MIWQPAGFAASFAPSPQFLELRKSVVLEQVRPFSAG